MSEAVGAAVRREQPSTGTLSPTEQAVVNFQQRYGITVELSAEEERALERAAQMPDGADTYLILHTHGLRVTISDEQRFDQLMVIAHRVRINAGLNPKLAKMSDDERMRALVGVIVLDARQGELNLDKVARHVLRREDPHARDRYEGVAKGALRQDQTTQPGLEWPEHDSLEGALLHVAPPDRLTSDQARARAKAIHENIDGAGTSDERKLIKDVFNLSYHDRVMVAEAFSAERGKGLRGEAALKRFVDEVLDDLSGREADVTRAYLTNPTGQMEAHDVIHLAVSGMFGNDEKTALRLLQRMSRAQLAAADAAMRKAYEGETLEEVVKGLRDDDEDFALFLINPKVPHDTITVVRGTPPREVTVEGGVSKAGLDAYALWQAKNGADDDNVLFRTLENMTGKDVLAASKVFYDVFPDERGKGDDGRSGNVRKTSLYAFLMADMDNDFERKRLHCAFSGGLRWDFGATSETEEAFRQRKATYAVYALAMNGEHARGDDSIADTMSTVGLLVPTRDGQRTSTTEPTVFDVQAAYRRELGGRNLLMDARSATNGDHEALITQALQGQGLNAPETRALQCYLALDTGPLGLAGVREEDLLRGLSDLTPEQQQATFAAYRRLFGKNLPAEVENKIGMRELPNGRKVPSAALVMVRDGGLPPSIRLVHALNQEVLGFIPITDWATIRDTLGGATPLERVLMAEQYQALTGSSLWGDLRAQGPEGELWAFIGQIKPHEGLQLESELMVLSNPELAPPEVIRGFERVNLGPSVHAGGAAALRQRVLAAGGPAAFARQIVMTDASALEAQERVALALRGNGVLRTFMDMFGPEGAGLENATRDLRVAAERVAVGANGEPLDPASVPVEALEALQLASYEYAARAIEYGRLKGITEDVLINVVTSVALASTVIAWPAAPTWALAFVGASSRATASGVLGRDSGTDMIKGLGLGALGGVMTGLTVSEVMGIPSGVSFFERAAREGIAGAKVGALAAGADVATRQATHTGTFQQSVGRTLDSAGTGAVVGGAVAAGASLLRQGAERAVDAVDGDPKVRRSAPPEQEPPVKEPPVKEPPIKEPPVKEPPDIPSGGQPPGEQPPGTQPGINQPQGGQPPGTSPGVNQPPGDTPPGTGASVNSPSGGRPPGTGSSGGTSSTSGTSGSSSAGSGGVDPTTVPGGSTPPPVSQSTSGASGTPSSAGAPGGTGTAPSTPTGGQPASGGAPPGTGAQPASGSQLGVARQALTLDQQGNLVDPGRVPTESVPPPTSEPVPMATPPTGTKPWGSAGALTASAAYLGATMPGTGGKYDLASFAPPRRLGEEPFVRPAVSPDASTAAPAQTQEEPEARPWAAPAAGSTQASAVSSGAPLAKPWAASATAARMPRPCEEIAAERPGRNGAVSANTAVEAAKLEGLAMKGVSRVWKQRWLVRALELGHPPGTFASIEPDGLRELVAKRFAGARENAEQLVRRLQTGLLNFGLPPRPGPDGKVGGDTRDAYAKAAKVHEWTADTTIPQMVADLER